MKIALVSDTHGVCREELLTQIKKCDYLIHVGDFDREHVYNTLQELAYPCMRCVETVTGAIGRLTCMNFWRCP